MRKHNFIKAFVLLLLALVFLLPVVMLFSGSFMGADEVSDKIGPVLSENAESQAKGFLLPRYPTLQPYVQLLLDSPEFFHMFWNTCRIVFPVLLGQLFVSAPAAWALAKFRFQGRKCLFLLYIALMLMPFQVTMVSNYFVLDQMHLLDHRLAVILPGIWSTFPVFLMYRFFQSIPDALLEAASVDGAGPLRTFLSVGLPLGAPGIASAMILSFLEFWNVLEQPLAFFKDRSLWPLSLFLPDIVSDQAALSLAASVIALLPALLVFLLGKKHLEEGIRAAGLKG